MLFIIVSCDALYCDAVPLFACHVFVFYNSPRLTENNDSSLCVWLYNYHEAWAYYSQRNCGGVLLCTVRKHSVCKTSEIFHQCRKAVHLSHTNKNPAKTFILNNLKLELAG